MSDERLTNRPADVRPAEQPSGFPPPAPRPSLGFFHVVQFVFSTVVFAGIGLFIDHLVTGFVARRNGVSYPYLSATLAAVVGLAVTLWYSIKPAPRATRVVDCDLPGPDEKPRARLSLPVPPSSDIATAPRPAPLALRPEQLHPHFRAVTCVAISPDGGSVASCDETGELYCQSLDTGLMAWQIEEFLPGQPGAAIAFSPDGLLLAACSGLGPNEGIVYVLDARSGLVLRELDMHGSPVGLVWMPDSRHLLIGCTGAVRVWHVDEEAEAGCLSLPTERGTGEAACLALDAEGRVLVAGMSHSFEAHALALPDGTAVMRFERHREGQRWFGLSGILSAAITPDGQFALTGCHAGTARVWNVRTGEEICRFEGHAGWWGYRGITGVAFLPGGSLALSACEDGTLCLWDAHTGQEVARWDHGKGVRCLALSADGKLAVSGAWEGSIRVWYLE
jgi:WD40 repeat protein